MSKSIVFYVQHGLIERDNKHYASMLCSGLKFTVKDDCAGYRANKINICTDNYNALAKQLLSDLKKAGKPIIIDAELEQVDSKDDAKFQLIDYTLLSDSMMLIHQDSQHNKSKN